MIKMMNEKEIRNEFINCIERSHTLNLAISVLEEREQLQNNWNELKNYLEKQIIDSKAGSSQQYYFNTIYKFMQELESNNDSKRDV